MQTPTGWTDKGGTSTVPLTHAAWQPIETAPNDGTRVLLYRAGYAEAQCIGYWSSDFDMWLPVNGSIFPGATHWAQCPVGPA